MAKRLNTAIKIKNYIKELYHKASSVTRLFVDYLSQTTVNEYESWKQDTAKKTILERFLENSVNNTVVALWFGSLIWLMLGLFGVLSLSLKNVVSISIAYGLLRHCLKRIFNKEI